jgi:RNase P subunit RPR2
MKITALASRDLSARAVVERRDSMCKDCVTVRGAAFAVVVGGQQKLVSYRCPTCGRIWRQRTDDGPSTIAD